MDLYVVPRMRAWHSEEELAAAADCGPAVAAALGGRVRWIRSYVIDDGDGMLGAFCLYEAESPEALREYADAMKLPPDGIHAVARTVVGAPDPEPVALL